MRIVARLDWSCPSLTVVFWAGTAAVGATERGPAGVAGAQADTSNSPITSAAIQDDRDAQRFTMVLSPYPSSAPGCVSYRETPLLIPDRRGRIVRRTSGACQPSEFNA